MTKEGATIHQIAGDMGMTKMLRTIKGMGDSTLDRMRVALKAAMINNPDARSAFDEYLDTYNACAKNITVTPDQALDTLALAVIMRPINETFFGATALDQHIIGAAIKKVLKHL